MRLLLDILAPPTDVPGRRRSYHRVLWLVGGVALAAVLLAPLRVAVVTVAGVVVVWWLTDSLHRERW